MSLPEDEFRRLMARVRAGSEEAARELLDRYSGHISRVVRRRLHRRPPANSHRRSSANSPASSL